MESRPALERIIMLRERLAKELLRTLQEHKETKAKGKVRTETKERVKVKESATNFETRENAPLEITADMTIPLSSKVPKVR